jgi:hypothetical protein
VFARIRLIISIVLVERTAIWSAANWPVFVFVVSPARCCEDKRVLQLADWQRHSLAEAQQAGFVFF